MYSPVEENYLKALFHLSENGTEEVNVKDLSLHLAIKMPTVNSMVKKLADKELVYYETYKPLRLTEQGILKAALIVRKHRLTEMFLVEKMGFGWEEVHHVAEQIEHIKSDLFFDKMDQILNYPKVDPHGSPIPDSNGKFDAVFYKKLSEYQVGDIVELSAVTFSSEEFLKYLSAKNIALGNQIEILSIEPFDGTMEVFINRKKVTFSKIVADKLLVK